MRCLCVYGSVALASGLTLIGGPASAHSQEIGTSPATRVVARAPLAVSVTFDRPVRSPGIVMEVLGPGGVDFGTGQSSVYRKTTVRRDMKLGSPAGAYTVTWAVVSEDGHQQSGSFEFTAARANTAPLTTQAPSVVAPTTPTASTGVAGAGGAPGKTSGAPQESARTTATAPARASLPPFVQPAPSLIGSDSEVRGALGEPGTATNGEDGGSSRSVFTYLPLGLGAVLVVAAGLVSLVTRRRSRLDDMTSDQSTPPISR
jgi:copper resistance protein C